MVIIFVITIISSSSTSVSFLTLLCLQSVLQEGGGMGDSAHPERGQRS